MEDPFKMIPIDDILNTYYKDMNRYINAQSCWHPPAGALSPDSSLFSSS